MNSISAFLIAAGLAGLIAASLSDLKERIIHNEVVLYTLAVGIALRLLATPEMFWVSIGGAAFLFVVLGYLAHFDVIGGGDAKLIAAATLLAPPQQAAPLMVDIAIAGGLLSCLYLAARFALRSRAVPEICNLGGGAHDVRAGLLRQEAAKIVAGEPMPYALAILGGSVFYVFAEVRQCFFATSCSL